MASGEGFKSFKDLLRARGGEPSESEQEKRAREKGWHLEEQGAEVDSSELEDVPRPDTAARDRIGARPSAFGPMTHGPAVYADPDSEEMQLLHSFRVRTVFPEDVLKELRGLPPDPAPADFEGRVDLRDRTIFTIDGDDAKDYDDAIEMTRLANGNLELGVHIADVSHYVRPDTALDAEALARATSVYVPGQVVPMLPEALSNGLCSLVPHRDRLAFSVYMEFDPDGKRVSKRMHKSVIRSAWRNTYRVVQELFDGVESEETREIAHLAPMLGLLRDWTRQQQSIRDAKGSLRMQSTEKKFVFNDQHEVTEIVDAPKYFSMALIEETALAANQAVGDHFREHGLPTIYRVHPQKDQEEIDSVAKQLEEYGIRVPNKERLSGRDIGRMIRAARKKPNAEALIARIMGLVERAYYEVRDHEDVAEHWGLARKAYLHFTSPIRRYPDLIVHRWLYRVLAEDAEALEQLRSDGFVEDLNDQAGHSSMQADLASMCEQAMHDLKVCQYMEPHIGEKLDARVLRVSRPGMDVLLSEFNVRGFLPARSIGDRVKVDGPTITIGRGKRILSFSEGHAVAVRIKDIDFIRLQVLLELDA
jgi:ribonuclease R